MNIRGVTKNEKKFYLVIAALPPDLVAKLSVVLVSTKKYRALGKVLLIFISRPSLNYLKN